MGRDFFPLIGLCEFPKEILTSLSTTGGRNKFGERGNYTEVERIFSDIVTHKDWNLLMNMTRCGFVRPVLNVYLTCLCFYTKHCEVSGSKALLGAPNFFEFS